MFFSLSFFIFLLPLHGPFALPSIVSLQGIELPPLRPLTLILDSVCVCGGVPWNLVLLWLGKVEVRGAELSESPKSLCPYSAGLERQSGVQGSGF